MIGVSHAQYLVQLLKAPAHVDQLEQDTQTLPAKFTDPGHP